MIGRFVSAQMGEVYPERTIRDVMDGSASGDDTYIIERDATTGQFVPLGTAALYPGLTISERIRHN